MAIDKKDYPIKIEDNLWADNNHVVFFYNFMFEKKRYRGLIDLRDKTSWGKKDRVTYAKGELVRIKNTKRDVTINTNITLAAYMEEYWKSQPDTKYTATRKSHYERHVKPHIGQKKLIELRQIHIEQVLKKQEEPTYSPGRRKTIVLSERTRLQTLEVLRPAFKKAVANRIIPYNPCDGIALKLPSTKKNCGQCGRNVEQNLCCDRRGIQRRSVLSRTVSIGNTGTTKGGNYHTPLGRYIFR